MSYDAELISTEEHELNYLLKKWNRKQSISNREKLVHKIEEFNSISKFRTHNREDFYTYVNFIDTLEA